MVNYLIMLNSLNENLILMLTGSTMAFFGAIFYKSVGSAFLSGGLFRNKFEALIIFLISIPLMSIITLLVRSFWEAIILLISFYDVIGLILIVGMLAVNYTVKNWNYFDIKSVTIYLIGFLMILIL